jgi:hypothetical protein
MENNDIEKIVRPRVEIPKALLEKFKNKAKEQGKTVNEMVNEYVLSLVGDKSLETPQSEIPNVFWCGGTNEDGSECCFNHWIGLPTKKGQRLPLFDYEDSLFQDAENNKHIWVLKATGLGVTEFFLRYMTWKALTDSSLSGSRILIIVGPNQNLAEYQIGRITKLLHDKQYCIKRQTATIIEFPNVTVEAKPSHRIDASRSYENLSYIFVDEAAFFPLHDDSIVRIVVERYIGKSNPNIIMVSTPNKPNGFFYELERDSADYKKIYLPYHVGLGKIYNDEDIEQAKKSRGFEREYNLQWSVGIGDIFDHDDLTQEPVDFTKNDYTGRVLALDPAFGSSNFGCVAMEKREDGNYYVIMADKFERPTYPQMIEQIEQYLEEFGIKNIIIDSSNPPLIKQFSEKYNTISFNFRESGKYATENASQMVSEGRVKIDPMFIELLRELRAAKYSDKETVDKKIGTFDLYDGFIMACYYFKNFIGYSVVVNYSNKFSTVIDDDF